MYLFIFESIGTSELLLIGMVALIVFGPRKLPQIARTIGKTMADFRRTTDEFKSTWEKEVNFEETEFQSKNIINNIKPIENSVQRENTDYSTPESQIAVPEIKEMNPEDLEKILALKEKSVRGKSIEENNSELKENDKRSWL